MKSIQVPIVLFALLAPVRVLTQLAGDGQPLQIRDGSVAEVFVTDAVVVTITVYGTSPAATPTSTAVAVSQPPAQPSQAPPVQDKVEVPASPPQSPPAPPVQEKVQVPASSPQPPQAPPVQEKVRMPVNAQPTSTSTSSTSTSPPTQPGPAIQEKVALNAPPVKAPSQSTSTFAPSQPQSASPTALTVTQAPSGGDCASSGDGVFTWEISNAFETTLSISHANNAGGPSALGCPQAGALAPSAVTTLVFPTNWAGRSYIGQEAAAGDSLIEGSTTGWNDIDVSFVDGFSVPITCSNDVEVLTGCNLDLFKLNPCPDMINNNSSCSNPMSSVPEGPATPFFAPCEAAAYTYPKDDKANIGNTNSVKVSCCIGTACKAPTRQKVLASKRWITPEVGVEEGVEKRGLELGQSHAHAHEHLQHMKRHAAGSRRARFAR